MYVQVEGRGRTIQQELKYLPPILLPNIKTVLILSIIDEGMINFVAYIIIHVFALGSVIPIAL